MLFSHHSLGQKIPKSIFFHPFLIGIFPFLTLMANNIDQIRLLTKWRAGIIVLALCSILYLLLRRLLRNPSKAALVSSLWLIMFYSYGHVFQIIDGKSLLGMVFGRHRFLMVLWLALIFAGSWLILKKLKEPLQLNSILNTISLFLLLFPVFQISMFFVHVEQTKTDIKNNLVLSNISPSTADDARPDIYYIVLDGYSRVDMIQKLYGLDISPFLDELKLMGFVIPECAQSNYGFTGFSIVSALNMDYVDNFLKNLPFGSDNRVSADMQFRDFILNSQVRQDLQQQGYRMVAFETGWNFLEIENADIYIMANNSPWRKNIAAYQLTKFEDLFIRTTMLRILTDKNSSVITSLTGQIKSPREQQYDRLKYELDELRKIPSIPGKKFVYFHFPAPHAPFVIDKNGNFVTNEKIGEIPGYPDQVIYFNKRIPEIMRGLIKDSSVPPIIILQGDHGWDPRPLYRMQILNAYYLPGGGDKLLYPTITPVNTFRLIMDYYFGKELGLLKDASYYSLSEDVPEYAIHATPLKLEPVPVRCPSVYE